MKSLVRTGLVLALRRYLGSPELPVIAVLVLAIEVWGPPRSRSDADDILLVLAVIGMLAAAFSMARARSLPLMRALLAILGRTTATLRDRLMLSLGLDFHPERAPRMRAFTALRRATLALALAAVVLVPAHGILREILVATRLPGLYTLHVLLLGATWLLLLASIAAQLPAVVLGVLEIAKSRARLAGFTRAAAVILVLVLLAVLLAQLDRSVGLVGCLSALGFACVLPSVVRLVEPPHGPLLNIALGRDGRPATVSLGTLVRDAHRLLALEAFLIVCLLAPVATIDDGSLPVTDALLRVYGWTAAWLFTGGALLAVAEFNRRRRLFDPAFERSRVLWAVPGPEATALASERKLIEAAGWRLVIEDRLPEADDADLLAGLPPGLAPPGAVPLTRVPPALFLLAPDAGAVLCQADERDKSERAAIAIERLLAAAHPRAGERGEGTFLVPQCWLVVGLTRDEEKGGVDRPPPMTYGQSFQALLGSRLRRYLHEVMARAGVDVFYVEDAVTPAQVRAVLETLFGRHVARVEPGRVAEHDFLDVPGVRVVLHEVDPEVEGLADVDAHVTRHAISRARILIIGKDRRDDGGGGDGPPVEGESSDAWLRDSLRRMFPRLQPV